MKTSFLYINEGVQKVQKRNSSHINKGVKKKNYKTEISFCTICITKSYFIQRGTFKNKKIKKFST